jgi:predicted RNase H-like HicB family nuclease
MTTTTYTPRFATTVYPDRATDGRSCWVAVHPELSGVHGEGATKMDAQLDLDAAREAYFAVLRDTGAPVPQLTPSESLIVREDARQLTGSHMVIMTGYPPQTVTTTR